MNENEYTPRRDRRIGRTLAGKYVLEEVLGEGGMGTVYRARQLSVDRQVAVKLLRPAFVSDEAVAARFLREVRIASQLSHPSIVTVFDFGRTPENELFLVMELLRGQTLRDILTQTPIPVGRAIDVMAQICEALHYAHEAGLVHRDLKPDNVFLLDQPGLIGDKVKVLDFGLARSTKDSGRLTRTGMICGTPHYVSPEQARGETVGRAGDIYSLGILLFEMLTRQTPFDAESSLNILMAHVQQTAPRLREADPTLGISDALENLVACCLEKEPEMRPPTALDLRVALLESMSHHGSLLQRHVERTGQPLERVESLSAVTELTRELRTPRRRWLQATLATATLAITFVGGWATSLTTASPKPLDAYAGVETAAEAPAVAGIAEEPTWAPAPPPGATKPSAVAAPRLPRVTRTAHSQEDAAPRRAGDTVPASLFIAIETEPAGARVWRDGKLLGIAPVQAIRPATGEEVVLTARLAGHQTLREALDADGAQVTLTLERRAERPRRTPPKAPAPQGGPVILE